jgi:hypothetical protein
MTAFAQRPSANGAGRFAPHPPFRKGQGNYDLRAPSRASIAERSSGLM